MKLFTTLATVPDAPSSPGVSSITQDAVTVSYVNPNNGGSTITGHDVEITTDPGFSFIVDALTPAGLSATFTGLDPNTPHYVRVRARNAIGTGAWSAAGNFTTLPGVHLRASGAWVNAKPHNRISGAWVSSKTHGRVSGAWS